MGKISNYARVLKAKLQDVFVIDSTDNNVTSTKSVTVEQIGNAICGEQVHSDLKTDNQTIIGGINELAKDKNVADEYDDTHTYNTGDVCIYNNVLYICTAPTTGTFDPSKWTATTIDNVIGSLSALTTTDKSSIVGAVNEVVSTKADKSSFAKKDASQSSVALGANAITTLTITVNNAVFGLVVGFYISGDAVLPMQVYFSSATDIIVRLKNTLSTATTCNIVIYYI